MGFERAGFIRALWSGVLFATVAAGASCGGDSGGSETATSNVGTAGASAASSTDKSTSSSDKSAAAAGSGAADNTAKKPDSTMAAKPADSTPATSMSMMTTTPADNSGAAGDAAMAPADDMMAAAGDAAADPAAAGSDATGMDATGMDMGATMPDPGGAFAIRGPDPTQESANGRNMGPYSVESYTSGYMRGDFSDATMWYPTSAEAEPPFGCVAVVPGFVSPQSSIRNWGPFLASNGIVAITIGVPGSDQPQQRAMSLMSALETCMGENTREGSPIKGKLDGDHLGVAGWSMGGGGTLIAAANNPQLKAGVSFAAWGPRGGAMNTVPVLMFEATADPLAASMSDGFYRDTPDSVPKMLFEVQGSSHNVANDPGNHNGIIGLYGLSWFKVFLEGDERYRQFLLLPKPDITTNKFEHNLE